MTDDQKEADRPEEIMIEHTKGRGFVAGFCDGTVVSQSAARSDRFFVSFYHEAMTATKEKMIPVAPGAEDYKSAGVFQTQTREHFAQATFTREGLVSLRDLIDRTLNKFPGETDGE